MHQDLSKAKPDYVQREGAYGMRKEHFSIERDWGKSIFGKR
jgi:hypothetical protein